jgi:glutaredoxin
MPEKKIQVYGAMWCPDTLRAISYFNENKIDFDFNSIENNEENLKVVEGINSGLRIIPTIVFPNQMILTEPSEAELTRAIEKLQVS